MPPASHCVFHTTSVLGPDRHRVSSHSLSWADMFVSHSLIQHRYDASLGSDSDDDAQSVEAIMKPRYLSTSVCS